MRAGTVTFIVRIHPGARKTEVTETLSDGTIKIDIAAVPEDGKANAELMNFLAEAFQVSAHQIAILSGVTARRKLIRITR